MLRIKKHSLPGTALALISWTRLNKRKQFLHFLLKRVPLFLNRFGIDKIKLQHEAGNPTLIASCNSNHPGICKHPILHDIEITSSVVSGTYSGTNQMSDISNIALKNMARYDSANLKLYKSRRSNSLRYWPQYGSQIRRVRKNLYYLQLNANGRFSFYVTFTSFLFNYVLGCM